MTECINTVAAEQMHLQASAALLERAYRLTLALQSAQTDGRVCDTGDEATWLSQELLGVLDDARATLVKAVTSTNHHPGETRASPQARRCNGLI